MVLIRALATHTFLMAVHAYVAWQLYQAIGKRRNAVLGKYLAICSLATAFIFGMFQLVALYSNNLLIQHGQINTLYCIYYNLGASFGLIAGFILYIIISDKY
jgi:hypothetical protein